MRQINSFSRHSARFALIALVMAFTITNATGGEQDQQVVVTGIGILVDAETRNEHLTETLLQEALRVSRETKIPCSEKYIRSMTRDQDQTLLDFLSRYFFFAEPQRTPEYYTALHEEAIILQTDGYQKRGPYLRHNKVVVLRDLRQCKSIIPSYFEEIKRAPTTAWVDILALPPLSSEIRALNQRATELAHDIEIRDLPDLPATRAAPDSMLSPKTTKGDQRPILIQILDAILGAICAALLPVGLFLLFIAWIAREIRRSWTDS